MAPMPDNAPGRYDRQILFPPLGWKGQQALAKGRALVVGVGGLGCVTAELLARAGVGFLRLVDGDIVTRENLHRQVLYDEADAAAGRPKALAAAQRLSRLNSSVRVEAVVGRLEPSTAEDLARGIDVLVDGLDNFASRFVLNDLAVARSLPWVMAGAVGAECQTLTVVPGRTPCLRCVFEGPPPPCTEPTCRTAGVLPPAVVAIAAIQAAEALKLLAGQGQAISPYLLKMDLWTCQVQRIDVRQSAAGIDCPCCRRGEFEFLRGEC